jgi:hypothetical protein
MPKTGLDRSKTGRAKGTVNKTTALLKDAILKAAELAGGEQGLVGYLAQQAVDNPGPFMALLGKVLPLQIAGDPNNPLEVVTRIERVIIGAAEDAADRDAAYLPTAH